MFNLLSYEIRSRFGTIIGWVLGLTFYIMMYTLVYPDMQDEMAGLADIAIYQAMGIEIATFEGYIASTIIGLMPILVGVYVVMAATSTLAGEEDDGTLELLLSTRLKRWEIVTAKGVGLLVVTAIIMVIASFVMMGTFNMIKDDIQTTLVDWDLFWVVLSALPLIWAFMMFALFLGTVMPSRRIALMSGLVFLIYNYFGENLGGMLSSLEFLRPFSLFSYFDTSSAVFKDGIAISDVSVLLIFSAICFGLAIIGFNRRDVTVGNWPWQRVTLE